MGRPKAWWTSSLFSFGARYISGKADGFHIAARADDGTKDGRIVDLQLTDGSVRLLILSMTEYMGRDRSKDAGPQLEGDKT